MPKTHRCNYDSPALNAFLTTLTVNHLTQVGLCVKFQQVYVSF